MAYRKRGYSKRRSYKKRSRRSSRGRTVMVPMRIGYRW